MTQKIKKGRFSLLTFMVEKDEVDCHGSHMAEREARGLDPCGSVIPVPFPPSPSAI
jgi:hypothetical protein